MDTNVIWTLATIGGPVVLILVMGYAVLRRRRLTPTERSDQIKGTERGYKKPEKNA